MQCYVEISSGSWDWLDLARLTLNVELKIYFQVQICVAGNI